MRNSQRTVGFGLALFLIAGGLACCSKPKPTPAAEVKPVETPVPTPTPIPVKETPVTPVAEPPKVTDIDADLDTINKKGYLKDVFFDFDKFDIRADQRDPLSANAEWMKKYPSVKIRVEGHCDERGTAQYNMALGEKRANAVKEYLATLGIDAGRIETVSFGKERPFAAGHDEDAWAQNRRGHFVVTAK